MIKPRFAFMRGLSTATTVTSDGDANHAAERRRAGEPPSGRAIRADNKNGEPKRHTDKDRDPTARRTRSSRNRAYRDKRRGRLRPRSSRRRRGPKSIRYSE